MMSSGVLSTPFSGGSSTGACGEEIAGDIASRVTSRTRRLGTKEGHTNCLRSTSGGAARSGPGTSAPRNTRSKRLSWLFCRHFETKTDVTARPEPCSYEVSSFFCCRRFSARDVSSSPRAKRPRRGRRARRQRIAKLLRCMTTEVSPRHALYTPTGAGSPPDARKNPSILFYFILSPSAAMVFSYEAGSSFLRYFESLDLCPRSMRNPRWVA